MITEQRLSEIADLEYIPKPGTNDFKDLVRLARLGIWSLNHGIPAVEAARDFINRNDNGSNAFAEALAQLPKQGDE